MSSNILYVEHNFRNCNKYNISGVRGRGRPGPTFFAGALKIRLAPAPEKTPLLSMILEFSFVFSLSFGVENQLFNQEF